MPITFGCRYVGGSSRRKFRQPSCSRRRCPISRSVSAAFQPPPPRSTIIRGAPGCGRLSSIGRGLPEDVKASVKAISFRGSRLPTLGQLRSLVQHSRLLVRPNSTTNGRSNECCLMESQHVRYITTCVVAGLPAVVVIGIQWLLPTF